MPAEFTDRDNALAWLDEQGPNLIAAVTMAAGTSRYREAMVLPPALSTYLDWRWRFDDWLAVLAVSRDTARQLNHNRNEASALAEVPRFEEAISAHQDAAAIYRDMGDRHREGMALNNLGLALVKVRRFEEAIACFQQDIAICQETGDRYGEGQARPWTTSAAPTRRCGSPTGRPRTGGRRPMRDAGNHEEAARLEQLATNAQTGQQS